MRDGRISLEEACRRYELSTEEFLAWQRAIEIYGVGALRITRLQIYRDTPRLVNPAAEFPSRCPRRCGKRPGSMGDAGMLRLYAARIEDLGRGDLLKVDCAGCHHVALLTPEALLRVGLGLVVKVLVRADFSVSR